MMQATIKKGLNVADVVLPRSIAVVARRTLATIAPSASTEPTNTDGNGSRKPRLVVLGTGWAGYPFLKDLKPAVTQQFDIKVISPTTYFSFTPLLAQASCGTLDFRSVIEPVHSTPTIEAHHGWCDAIDFTRKELEITPSSDPQFHVADPLSPHQPTANRDTSRHATYKLGYDYLVISVGSYNATFGTQGVKEHALFLKDASDARAIRWRILQLFETANILSHQGSETESEIKALLSFVVVGGGPTGSEFAAELHDLVTQELKKAYPHLSRFVNIQLLDAGKSILSSFDQGLSKYAMKKFARDGIHVKTQQKILRVEQDAIVVAREDGKEEKVPTGLVVWSTGITTSPLIEAIQGVPKEEKSGKLLTDDHLRLLINEGESASGSVLDKGRSKKEEKAENLSSNASKDPKESGRTTTLDHVWAIGDCASQTSGALPATAQVASQKGQYLAKLFNENRIHAGGSSPASTSVSLPAFKFLNKGSMASIGGSEALIETPVGKESGRLAWLLWRSAYTIMSMSWRNRFLVPANWLSNLIFGRDVGRF